MGATRPVRFFANPKQLAYVSWFFLIGMATLAYGRTPLCLIVLAISGLFSVQIFARAVIEEWRGPKPKVWWSMVFVTDFSGLLIGLATYSKSPTLYTVGGIVFAMHVVLCWKMSNDGPVPDERP